MEQDSAGRVQPEGVEEAKTEQSIKPGASSPVSGPKRAEPQEALPTDRVSFEKQLHFLLAYAAASENGTKGVSNESVGGIVNMKASTVSLANAFFVRCGFLTRSGREYLPSKEVLEYKLADGWGDQNAAHKLAPLINKCWFAQTLRPKLDMRPIEESEAIADLAQRAVVTRDYELQLRTLLDYMEKSGICRREGTLLVLNRGANPSGKVEVPAEVDKRAASPMSGFSGGQGAISLNVSIDVNMAEISSWRPDRITAFFSGLAMVVAAKKGDGEPNY